MTTDILLFDMPSGLGSPTSPNVWKVRLALNYKGLNYKTQWVPTPSIEATLKPFGIKPTGVKPNGQPHYTLPAIIDRTNPSEPVYMSDSFPIIEYLERTYPSPSKALFPPGTKGLQSVFETFVQTKALGVAPSLLIMGLYNSKTAEDKADFRQRMEARFGNMESIEKQGAEREAVLKDLEATFTTLSGCFMKEGGIFVMGNQPCLADFTLCGLIIFLKGVSPDEIWTRMSVWDNGRWDKYLQSFQDWMAVDNHP
ncbi:hypothetical protein B0H34DRAFT_530490 [Crassisporium funariophilum]|nr:hypothetical protein B0H34DRAFT_530490 [Crassisporium funariophilum]